jgi:hypothetical protein
MTEKQQETEFRPLGGSESTEDAEYGEHDLGTESSQGRGAEATGSYPPAADAEAKD